METASNNLMADPHGFIPAPLDLPPPLADKWTRLNEDGLRPATENMIAGHKRLDKDPNFTSVGRREEKAKRNAAIVAEMDRIVEAQLKPVLRDLEHERPKLAAEHRLYRNETATLDDSGNYSTRKVRGEGAFAEAQVAREIRDRLLALPAEQRLERAREAARNNDETTLRAIHSAPASFPVLSADEWDEVDRLHIERHYTKQFQFVRDLERTVQGIRWNLAAAKKAIGAPHIREATLVK